MFERLIRGKTEKTGFGFGFGLLRDVNNGRWILVGNTVVRITNLAVAVLFPNLTLSPFVYYSN